MVPAGAAPVKRTVARDSSPVVPAPASPTVRLSRSRSRPPSPSPRVSVLLPARDAAATLPACLASLSRQREERWECVLVDDGSRDETASLAEAAAARESRIRVLRGERRGLVASLQQGLAACRAPTVARLDADDWMHRDRLALQLAALDEQPSWAGVGSHVRIFPRRALRDGMREYERWLNTVRSAGDVWRERFVESPLAHPTWLWRRELLETFGYSERGWPEDYDLLLRVLEAGHRLGVVPRRLVGWRDSPARLTRSHAAYGQERIVACKAWHLARGFLRDQPRYVLWGHGGTGRSLRRALEAEGRRPAYVIEVHPGRLGQRIHGAPVVSPNALGSLPRLPLVASVAGASARQQIRAALAGLGWRETEDFVCAA